MRLKYKTSPLPPVRVHTFALLNEALLSLSNTKISVWNIDFGSSCIQQFSRTIASSFLLSEVLGLQVAIFCRIRVSVTVPTWKQLKLRKLRYLPIYWVAARLSYTLVLNGISKTGPGNLVNYNNNNNNDPHCFFPSIILSLLITGK